MAGPGGKRSLSWWREAREWWLGEPSREFHTYTDEKGIRREAERELPTLGVIGDNGQKPLDEVHNEEWSLRIQKTRDEKCSAAMGNLPKAYYERAAQDAKWDMGRNVQKALQETAWSVVTGQTNGTKLVRKRAASYAALHLFSGYAFGRSTMLAEELSGLAGHAGCVASCIADPHSLIGAVEHVKACKRVGIKPLVGTSIEVPEGGELVLIAKSKQGYQNLSRLVTACHLGEPRSFPLGSWERLEAHSSDLICLTGGDYGPLDRLIVSGDYEGASQLIVRLRAIYGQENVYLEVERSFLPWMLSVGRHLRELGERHGVQCVAGGAVTHPRPEHYPAQDSLICAHTLCTIDEVVGRKEPRDPSQPWVRRFPERALNGERYLRTADEMAALYSDRRELIEATLRIAEQCEDDVLPARPGMPRLFDDDSHALREIVTANAANAYGKIGTKQRKRLDMEMERISNLGYASHFLIAWDFCRWAREQGIQSSGRGSAVDSAVAYVLGFSRIDAIEHNLHFDRFLPADGSKRPDIDIDFEARRRDDIRGYMIGKYGVDRVGAVCAIGTYMTRGIVREVGKVMGLPPETVSFLSKRIHGGVSPNQLEAALEKRPELRDSNIPKEKFRWVMELANCLMDVPRNIRTHSSGVVICDRPLADIVPVMWSATPSSDESKTEETQLRMIQWDKRSAKHYFDKFDVLCLRGQDVLSGIETRVRTTNPDFSAERLPATTDPDVFRAMRSGELIGVPQSASPAMRQAHVRLGTDTLHDASLVQAGIRPGVGGAVKLNELIARRRGKPYSFTHPKLEEILGITYGIIVFQEQVDQLLQAFCDYTGGQAEDIRDAIHKRRREDYGSMIKQKLIERMLSLGHSVSIAEEVFEYIAGFKGYGFAQGHALAFAEISLRSVYLMQHHPSEYFSALLSAQPAGYYGPATIANEARIRGVKMLGLDVNRSQELFQPEKVKNELGVMVPNGGIRTGLMQLNGLSDRTKARVLEHQMAIASREPSRELQPLKSVRSSRLVATLERHADSDPPDLIAFGGYFDFVSKARPDRDELEALILCGGLDSLCSNRRAMMWSIPQAQEFARLVDYRPGVLNFDYQEPPLDLAVEDFSESEKRIHERSLLGMDVDSHLLSFERDRIASRGGLTTSEAKRLSHGDKGFSVGNPIRLRFPPTKSGKRVVFFDLEDETGLLNVTCFDDVYLKYGHAIVTQPYVTVKGEYQDRDGYPAFLASSVHPYNPLIGKSKQALPIKVGDFLVG